MSSRERWTKRRPVETGIPFGVVLHEEGVPKRVCLDSECLGSGGINWEPPRVLSSLRAFWGKKHAWRVRHGFCDVCDGRKQILRRLWLLRMTCGWCAPQDGMAPRP